MNKHFIKVCILLAIEFIYVEDAQASFIESTIGTAVVNDATATFYNPAALTVLANPQLIGQGSFAYFNSEFNGITTQAATGLTQSGSSQSNTHYYLPSLYLGTPINSHFSVGLAIVANYFNRDIENNSILRYVQASNSIQDIDVVPAVGLKLNDYLRIGAGINISHAKFVLEPISGIPSLNIPDSQSFNNSSGTSQGYDIGILLTPSKQTTLGFNFRSEINYSLNGSSRISSAGNMLISPNYHFKYFTPARYVFSINRFLSSNWGVIGTLQRIQSDIYDTVNIFGIAAQQGNQFRIVNASVPFHFKNIWLVTLGTYYRFSPQWILRVAGTFNQSPNNPRYQIGDGNSFVLGGSASYTINKMFIVDGSYAHAFIQKQSVNIATGRNLINGVNQSFRDSISLKLTVNL